MAVARDGGVGQVGGSWKSLVGIGVLLAVLGLVALWNAVDATIVTAILIGYVLVVSGIMHVIGGFMPGPGIGWRVVHILIGVVWIVVGFNLAFDPLSGALALTLVVALMLIVEGLTRIVASLMGRVEGGWMLAVGIIDVLLGVWLWTGFPFTGVAIGLFVGVELLFAGLTMIAVGWSSRTLAPQEPTGTV
jgi:uncharacterized membrane protein HdeD (DUF308 family)